ncbi:DUF3467 domain-containing protein [Sagittula salina]|uniref:DUF3467 domain-containing protein n=1 Tax=Sagittula salina TaxID=2820268 RepID=A0A940MR76_9RHOB|nr:DUF3467 domain-containing protein [Sagittula salina]
MSEHRDQDTGQNTGQKNGEDVATRMSEGASGGTRDVKVRFDDSKMTTAYANVANVGMSRDEVSLLFGVNRTWGAVGDSVTIELSNRIILTPAVARSFSETLQRVLAEYDRQMTEGSGN